MPEIHVIDGTFEGRAARKIIETLDELKAKETGETHQFHVEVEASFEMFRVINKHGRYKLVKSDQCFNYWFKAK